MTRSVNQAGLDLIRIFEGTKLEAYQDVAGVWTIGTGHTGPEVVKGLKWTSDQADAAFRKDVGNIAAAVEGMVKVPLTDNQFAALVAFAYNLGPGRLRNSTLLKLVNAQAFKEARMEFLKWNKAAGKEVPGLTRRRLAESDLFSAV